MAPKITHLDLIPGISAVNRGNEEFKPCTSGTPKDGEDHFEWVQPDGSFAKICSDKTQSLIWKLGYANADYIWAIEKGQMDRPLALQILSDPNVKEEFKVKVLAQSAPLLQTPMTDPTEQAMWNMVVEDLMVNVSPQHQLSVLSSVAALAPHLGSLQEVRMRILSSNAHPLIQVSVIEGLARCKDLTADTRAGMTKFLSQYVAEAKARGKPGWSALLVKASDLVVQFPDITPAVKADLVWAFHATQAFVALNGHLVGDRELHYSHFLKLDRDAFLQTAEREIRGKQHGTIQGDLMVRTLRKEHMRLKETWDDWRIRSARLLIYALANKLFDSYERGAIKEVVSVYAHPSLKADIQKAMEIRKEDFFEEWAEAVLDKIDRKYPKGV